MSSRHAPSLITRALAEHRVIVLALAILLVANVLAFALVVYPLSQRVANVEGRTRAADRELADARGEQAQAAGALTAKARAVERLDTFHHSVIPANLTEARLLLDPRLWEMGVRLGLQVRNVSFDEVVPREEGLTRLRMGMDLLGDYADARAFIRQIESAPELVIIDDVRLQEGVGDGTTLQLRLDVSTYYRTAEE